MHNDYSLLSGLIYCDKCQSRMFAKQRGGKGVNHDLYDYICNNKLRGGVELCNCQNLNGQQADDLVCEYLMQYTDENSSIYKLLEQLKRNLQGKTGKSPAESIEDKIKKCNSEIDNLINTLSQGDLGAVFIERVNIRITELGQELSLLKEEQTRLLKEAGTSADQEMQLEMLSNMLSSFKDNFKTLSTEEKRTFIKLIVKKIVWDGENLHIFIDGE